MCYTFGRTYREVVPLARPRNEELYNTIKNEAYRQLLSNGYTDTTYQSIATACGVTRAAVQNYFASKPDLALTFFGDLLTVINETIQKKRIHEENEFDTMFCIGQSFFSFLMQDAGSRKLLVELTNSREITSEVLNFEYQWGIRFIRTERTVTEEKFENDVIAYMGGFYELLYTFLKEDKPFDLPTQLGRVIRAIMNDHGYSYDDAKAFVVSHAMTPEELSPILAAIKKRLAL